MLVGWSHSGAQNSALDESPYSESADVPYPAAELSTVNGNTALDDACDDNLRAAAPANINAPSNMST